MKNFAFSKTSRDRLNTCHPDIIKVMELAIKRTEVDFGIASGHRSTEEQQALYAQGRTKPGPIVTNVDGLRKKSKHNPEPSEAVDIYAFVSGRASWDKVYLAYLGGVVRSCARELGVELRWGGNWDGDGILMTDQGLVDLPHWEI